MSLETLDRKIEALRADAANRISTYRRVTADVRADTTLSKEGKSLKLGGTKERVTSEVADLQRQENEAIAAEIQSLERSIGGTVGSASGADLISFRDAQDRANRTTNATDALAALRSAINTNDRELARAYLMRAVTQQDADPVAQALAGIGGKGSPWSDVVQEYANAYPDAAKAVDDLYTIRSRERDRTRTLLSAGAYVVL